MKARPRVVGVPSQAVVNITKMTTLPWASPILQCILSEMLRRESIALASCQRRRNRSLIDQPHALTADPRMAMRSHSTKGLAELLSRRLSLSFMILLFDRSYDGLMLIWTFCIQCMVLPMPIHWQTIYRQYPCLNPGAPVVVRIGDAILGSNVL